MWYDGRVVRTTTYRLTRSWMDTFESSLVLDSFFLSVPFLFFLPPDMPVGVSPGKGGITMVMVWRLNPLYYAQQ